MPQRAPGVPPPNALAWARYRSTLPGLSPQQQAENDVREQVAGQPIEQQQQAVQAAVKFQAQRGYQQDLASGMPAPQAMAKWGPMLFAPGSPGAMSAIKMQQPQIRNIGGKLVRIMPDGTAQPINVPGQVSPPQKWEPQDTIDYKAATERYNKNAEALSKLRDSTSLESGTESRRQMIADRREMQRISGKYGQGAAPGGVQPPGGASKSGRVKVKDSKGKTGSIPADQVDAAKAAGYTIVQ
jgi:predicted HAD superfamily Cof-like phosphohydrolase